MNLAGNERNAKFPCKAYSTSYCDYLSCLSASSASHARRACTQLLFSAQHQAASRFFIQKCDETPYSACNPYSSIGRRECIKSNPRNCFSMHVQGIVYCGQRLRGRCRGRKPLPQHYPRRFSNRRNRRISGLRRVTALRMHRGCPRPPPARRTRARRDRQPLPGGRDDVVRDAVLSASGARGAASLDAVLRAVKTRAEVFAGSFRR
jgi:hypothetical protein